MSLGTDTSIQFLLNYSCIYHGKEYLPPFHLELSFMVFKTYSEMAVIHKD